MTNKIESVYGKNAQYFIKTYNLNRTDDLSTDLQRLFQSLGISVVSFSEQMLQRLNNANSQVEHGAILSATAQNKGDIVIFYRNPEAIFYLNEEYSCREAIAYELGCLCKTGFSDHVCGSKTEKDIETLQFVRELLLPKTQLKEAIGQLLIPTTFSLARIFGVSQKTVIERLKELNIKQQIVGYNC